MSTPKLDDEVFHATKIWETSGSNILLSLSFTVQLEKVPPTAGPQFQSDAEKKLT